NALRLRRFFCPLPSALCLLSSLVIPPPPPTTAWSPIGPASDRSEVLFMPIIPADKAKSEYDVVIVGSGAGGGQAAYTLTLAGLKCVMLEAGRSYDPLTETPMFNSMNQAPLMGVPTPDKGF